MHSLHRSSAATQTSKAEQETIAKFAANRCRAAEIGVFEGINTRIIAENILSDGRLFAIDPFFRGRLGICWSEIIARREVERSGHRSKVQFVRKLSHDAVQDIEGQFDFVFLDGDHSLEAIQIDWFDWSQRIGTDGVILLHDTSVPPHNPRIAGLGSVRYFDEVICEDRRFHLLARVDSLNVLQRK
jgi:predicted O-methyltransferase YrrM